MGLAKGPVSVVSKPKQILIVTGMSGAGKSTVLRTLEDLGWETVDNLPVAMIERLIETDAPRGSEGYERPLAICVGTRTRAFDAVTVITCVQALRRNQALDVGTLFLDCAGAELYRRYSETRRRHPMALDRPVNDGIAREREMLAPLRKWANRVIDTTDLASNQLAQQIRATFSDEELGQPVLSVMSFGFARGLPRNADLVFDMRYLRNPHWVTELRPGTGLDADVAAYVAADPAYADSVARIEDLLLLLLPRYRAEGKSYVTIAIGCTGGRHRSVHIADRIARRLQAEGFSPTVTHRDLGTAPQDSLEGAPKAKLIS
ncbi:MAG: RNase adapter RapZ [Sphingomonadales bacterium]|nr:RNase adapter RapZ [Sphingomonadales bacterium]